MSRSRSSVHDDPPGHRVVRERHTGCCNMQDQIRLLKQEKAKIEERRQASVRVFRDWKNHLLADSNHGMTVDAFIMHCVLPRCILTAEDATYCAAFIRKLVLEDTPYFSFMYVMQQVCSAAPLPYCRQHNLLGDQTHSCSIHPDSLDTRTVTSQTRS